MIREGQVGGQDNIHVSILGRMDWWWYQKSEQKNARGRTSFTEKDEFGLAYVGFEVPMDHPGGDIENTLYV